MIKKSKKDFFRKLSFISHQLSPRSGFTLIEILIIFLIGSIVVSIGINSVSSYNNSQIFNQSVSDVFSVLNNTRSRAISQVKPASCGVNALSGFEVEINVSSGTYKQNAVCGTSRYSLNEGKLTSGVSFLSGSNTRILFNVGKGTVDAPGAIGITGFGKTSTIVINETGVVAIEEGSTITPFLSPSPTPTSGSSTPPPSSVTGVTRYSDGTFSKSGASGTVITAYATGAKSSTIYKLVAGTNGGNLAAPCSQNISEINSSSRASNGTGLISLTSGPVNLGTGTWQICFKEDSGTSVTSPVAFIVTSASATSTPVPTAGFTASTSVSITSITPNPATRSSAQSMTFTASVTGTNCTPVGSVEFFRNSETTRFTAGATSNSNPATASGPYNSGAFTVGSHQIYARFVPGGGSCPTADSSIVNLTVN